MSISALPSIEPGAVVDPAMFTAPKSVNANQIDLDMNYLRQTHVVFAIPMYGGQCFESIVSGLISWSNLAAQYQIDWSIMTLANESLISRGRNTLVAKFLVDHPDASHLMFIDSDIGFEPEQVLLLLNNKKDICGGLYPMKSLPLRWCANGVDGATTVNGLEEVRTTGTGFMLIKKSVFEKMNQHPSVVAYKNDIGLDPKYDSHMKTYFNCEVRDDRYLSEDWLFCDNWRQLGGQIFVDKRILLRHSGYYVYNKQEEDLLYKIYGTRFVEDICQKHNLRLVDPAGKTVNFQF